MRFLQINSVCGVRSTGRIATDIADALMAQGHECRVAYGREEVPPQYENISYRIGGKKDYLLHGLRTRLLDQHAMGSKAATERFIKWAEDYKPDLIHLHNLHGYYINIEVLFDYIRSSGVPVVWTMHDCWNFTGHCSHFSYAKCEKWKTGCEHCPQLKAYPNSWFRDNSKNNWIFKKSVYSGLDNVTIVTPSNWLRGLVQQSFLAEYPVRTIHNTIDTEIFRPVSGDFRARYKLEDRKILLGVATAWGKMKGLDDFVELSRHLDPSWAVVLVGLSKKQCEALPSSVIAIEETHDLRELAEIYSAADVLLNATYQDTYPTNNLEAQACGTPCITYATGGSVESVPEENIVAPGDLEAVTALLNKPLPIKKMELGKDRMTRDYLALYREILGI